jgi:hypothetical protein
MRVEVCSSSSPYTRNYFYILFTTVPVQAASNEAAVFNSINCVPNIVTIGAAVDGLGECGYPVVKYVDAAGCETR